MPTQRDSAHGKAFLNRRRTSLPARESGTFPRQIHDLLRLEQPSDATMDEKGIPWASRWPAHDFLRTTMSEAKVLVKSSAAERAHPGIFPSTSPPFKKPSRRLRILVDSRPTAPHLPGDPWLMSCRNPP